MNVFEIFSLIGSNIWLYGGAFLLVLSILVFVHEWGHYIIARMCGVKVETFSIGFGKELFGWQDGHGTRWKFSLIPLGGYVKMFGDTDPASATHDESVEADDGDVRPMNDSEREMAFFAKPVWKRAAIVFAGPAINYIFAAILMTALFAMNGRPVIPAKAGGIMVGSAAYDAGFQPGDIVVAVNDREIQEFSDLQLEMTLALDSSKTFVIDRGGERVEIEATPRLETIKDRFGFQHTRGLLGISPVGGFPLKVITKVDGQVTEDEAAVRRQLLKVMGKPFPVEVEFGEGENVESISYLVNPPRDENAGLRDPESENYGIVFWERVDAFVRVDYTPIEAFGEAIDQAKNITTGTLRTLGQIILGTRSTKELGGIVRISVVAHDVAKAGLVSLISLMATLSVVLGLMNLLPIPLLDGGHLLFYGFETILGRPVPEQVQEYAFRAGFVFLIGVMVFANLNDILQLLLPS